MIPPSCVQSVEMRVSQSGLVGRNCCQTIISASPQSSQKGVASHWKGARNRPYLQLARTRPSAINWSSAWWEGGLSFAGTSPGSFRAGEAARLRKSRASNFSGRRPHQTSRQHRIWHCSRAPLSDVSRLPGDGRTDSDLLRLSRSTRIQSVNPQTPCKPSARLRRHLTSRPNTGSMVGAILPTRAASSLFPRLSSTVFSSPYRSTLLHIRQISLPFLPRYSLAIPAISLSLPSIPGILEGIWEGILKAVPKKKTSHAKKRHRQMAGKALKDVNNLCKCPVCGGTKRMHHLCETCMNSKISPICTPRLRKKLTRKCRNEKHDG